MFTTISDIIKDLPDMIKASIPVIEKGQKLGQTQKRSSIIPLMCLHNYLELFILSLHILVIIEKRQ